MIIQREKIFDQKIFLLNFLADNCFWGNDFATIKNIQPKVFFINDFAPIENIRIIFFWLKFCKKKFSIFLANIHPRGNDFATKKNFEQKFVLKIFKWITILEEMILQR